MIRRPPRSTPLYSSAASDVYKRQDYEFVRHQTGTSMHREQMVEMMNMMMANEKVVIRNARCVYENDEVLVEHSVMDFPDGTTEAVMAVHMLQEGKIIRTETGATLIPK